MNEADTCRKFVVLAGQLGVEWANSHEWVNGFDLFRRGLQFFAPHIGRAMDDLSLKISEIHYIEIHHPQRAHSRRSQVQG